MTFNLTKYLTTVIFSLGCSFSFAQNSPTIPTAGVEVTKVIPVSPDAAALGKYGNIPISPYTGVPNISIPLNTITSGDLSLPISLSYHAGGNKIEEQASSVGLGWTLNAGGAIIRTIRGKADDEAIGGFLDGNHYVTNILSTINGNATITNDQLNLYLNQIADGSVDGEADIYNYNFGGYSGRFVMDSYGQVSVIPQNKIIFTFDIDMSGIQHIRAFTAKVPDGTTYYFGSINDGNDAIEQTRTTNNCATPLDKKYFVTSWFLKRIVSPTGHQINFFYNAERCDIGGTRTQTKYQFYYSQDPNYIIPMPDESCNIGSNVYTVKLSTIKFENGQVNVYSNTMRNDLLNSKLIDSIAIIKTGGFSKSYYFNYTNNSTSRLRLDSLISRPTYSLSNKSNIEKYSFDYNSDSWSPDAIYRQDFWGYNNGHNENNTLVPAAYFVPLGQTDTVRLDGAERSTDENSMLGGMLTKITYPTGGYTTFSYEANDEYNFATNGTANRYPKGTSFFSTSNDPASTYYNHTTNGSYNIGFFKVYSTNNKTMVYLQGSGFDSGDSSDPSSLNNYIVAGFSRVDSFGNGIDGVKINNYETQAYLPNGYYKIAISDPKHHGYTADRPDGIKYEAYVSWHNDNSNEVHNYIVGGLRIKQIADYDGISNKLVNFKTYTYTLANQNFSSGWIDQQPSYVYYLNKYYSNTAPVLNSFFTRAGNSIYPLASTQGSVVGYSHVTEYFGQGELGGKNEYFYTNSQSTPDVIFDQFPFVPSISRDWKRGLLLKQATYRQANDGSYIKMQERKCVYNSDHQSNTADCIKAGFNPLPLNYNSINLYYNGPAHDPGGIVFQSFHDITDFTYLASDTTKIYETADTNRFMMSHNTYNYHPSILEISQIASTNSKNETIIKSITYPSDYTLNPFGTPTGSTGGIYYMQANGILNAPIEEITRKQTATASNLRVVGAVLNTYKRHAPLRDSVFVLRTLTGLTDFTSSSAGGNNISKDTRYGPAVSFDLYDIAGNILQERKAGDALHSYLWGYPDAVYPYPNTLPIAEVINADTSNIAYTNFESYPAGGYGLGNWLYYNTNNAIDTYAPMGNKCYSLNSGGSVTKNGLNSTTSYFVSLWSKQGSSVLINGNTLTPVAVGAAKNGWTFYKYRLNGITSVAVTGTGLIDELRLYPVEAQMSTYTYIPLVGMTAKCDTKNEISTFTHDANSRLSVVRDQDNNIIKKIDYNLAQTPYNTQSNPTLPSISACNTEGYKLINGNCVYGNQVYTGSVLNGTVYTCTYHYEWPDGTKSPDYTQMSYGDCSTQ